MDANLSTDCKGCLNSQIPIPGRPENFRPGRGRWVTEAEYSRRVAVCRTCPSLLLGTTCSHCGCVVRYLSALKDKACPHPAGGKWII
ncbi:MAG TPA: hypothetical protein DCZ94_16625 [Lentisphaeria bacterium]|nr:MAG: hypothetical protein A2X48_00175 [Lentisphaerae bacterium GWF2_49_21]HBC88573.1 hypothetical protein [Lentisphaeria bacterium]